MNKTKHITPLVLLFLISFSCIGQYRIQQVPLKDITAKDIKVGAERTEIYFPWIMGKNVAVVANHTSMIQQVHLVDSLMNAGIRIKKVFCPEHGFRGDADAGENLTNTTDKKTGLPVISLYGKNKKPQKEDLIGVDVVIFDIQDVGARFYTYISTMTYVMEACAENNILCIILDRPNPNGYYVDGPILEKEFSSFVGMHEVPIVHGMTMAEYAGMIVGEQWLPEDLKCNLRQVRVYNYNHTYLYELPIKPSPNLASMEAIYLYPSLCLLEGTCVSVGRGTLTPFEIIGHPLLDSALFSFTPVSIPGMSKKPPFEGTTCYGYNFHNYAKTFLKGYDKLYLYPLIALYEPLHDTTEYFTKFFDKLAGTANLRNQITQGVAEEDIRKSWEEGIQRFKKIRKKYLLYPDFE